LALAARASVVEIKGNIAFVDDGKRTEQLTTAGTDSMPAISPDGEKVVFVRSLAQDCPTIRV
jgi:Tol biopolymer transport system component